MAWFDLVGGLAGGLNQGLGQLEQGLQQRKREQDKAQQDFLEAVQAGRIDPLNVPAEVLQGLNPQQVKSLLVKDPTSKALQVRMDPTQQAKLQRTRAAEKNFYAETFATLTPKEQVLVAAQAGVSPQEAYLRMSPEARSVYAAATRPGKTPEISDLQAYTTSLTTQLKNAQDARKELYGNSSTVKQQRDQLDKRIAQLQGQLDQASTYLSTAIGGGTFTSGVTATAAPASPAPGGFRVGQQLRHKTTGAISVVSGLHPDGTPILTPQA